MKLAKLPLILPDNREFGARFASTTRTAIKSLIIRTNTTSLVVSAQVPEVTDLLVPRDK